MMLAERLVANAALRGQAFNFSYEIQVSVLEMVELILRKSLGIGEMLLITVARYSGPGTGGWPRCCPFAKPRFSLLRMSLTSGNRASTISAVASAEALSTTMTSMLRRGGASARLSKHSSK